MNSLDRLILTLTCAVSLAALVLASVNLAWQHAERSNTCMRVYVAVQVNQGTLLLPRTLCPPATAALPTASTGEVN